MSSSPRRDTIRPGSHRSQGPTTPRRSRRGIPRPASSPARIPRSPCSSSARSRRPRRSASTPGDVRGVQLCGAAKNVIAIAAGISDGLGFGDNARAGADHARPRRDDAPRLGARRRSPHLRRPRRPRRPRRDLHLAPLAQPRRRRAARARGVPPPRRPRSGWSSRACTRRPPWPRWRARPASTLPITDAVCSVIAGTPIPTALATLLARAAPAGESS